ncbi:hypothetical protein H9638_01920 [Arthrobacter sp. Sa2BUA2]|uniref:Uncharacterized protein n=1 Tax=Arthrobacter pullicola TaxID=2762224 RepID=A0ABR8YEC8_9MICC|nr:hypothetical protein [Arthrobacter pullicola]MBD8042560.1 hypothetical protein [Arthrobacter pullicola]
MAERGNSTHGRRMDEELKHETQNLTRSAVPDHAQEWRNPEPVADDTDSAEVQAAMGIAPADAAPETEAWVGVPDGED